MTWKIAEQKIHDREYGRICTPVKCQNRKCMTWKMTEKKMHEMEKGRKYIQESVRKYRPTE